MLVSRVKDPLATQLKSEVGIEQVDDFASTAIYVIYHCLHHAGSIRPAGWTRRPQPGTVAGRCVSMRDSAAHPNGNGSDPTRGPGRGYLDRAWPG
jgi:hypothetical protein